MRLTQPGMERYNMQHAPQPIPQPSGFLLLPIVNVAFWAVEPWMPKASTRNSSGNIGICLANCTMLSSKCVLKGCCTSQASTTSARQICHQMTELVQGRFTCQVIQRDGCGSGAAV